MPSYEATYKVRFEAENLDEAKRIVEVTISGAPGGQHGLPKQTALWKDYRPFKWINLFWTSYWDVDISIVSNK